MKFHNKVGLMACLMVSMSSYSQTDSRCLVEVPGSNPTDPLIVKALEEKGYTVQNVRSNLSLNQFGAAIRANTPEALAPFEGRAFTRPTLLGAGCTISTSSWSIGNRGNSRQTVRCQGSAHIGLTAIYGGEAFVLGQSPIMGQAFAYPPNATYETVDQAKQYIASQFKAAIPSCSDLKLKAANRVVPSQDNSARAVVEKPEVSSPASSVTPASANPN